MTQSRLDKIELCLSIAWNCLLIAALVPVTYLAWSIALERHAASQAVEVRQEVIGYSIGPTGVRHNQDCRFYNQSYPCSASDGLACKICGG